MIMKCVNKDIKLLLPDSLTGELDREDQARVRTHLESCEDCRSEVSLLRMMGSETVPEPPDAFWAELPRRVYRLVQEERNKKDPLRDLLHGMRALRWIQAAAAAFVIMLSFFWFFTQEAQHKSNTPAFVAENPPLEIVTPHDPILVPMSVTIAELTPSELDAVNAWASAGLSSLALEDGKNATAVLDTDLNEDLSELNAQEVDRLGIILDDLTEEG
jgi:hypothetical protein